MTTFLDDLMFGLYCVFQLLFLQPSEAPGLRIPALHDTAGDAQRCTEGGAAAGEGDPGGAAAIPTGQEVPAEYTSSSTELCPGSRESAIDLLSGDEADSEGNVVEDARPGAGATGDNDSRIT